MDMLVNNLLKGIGVLLLSTFILLFIFVLIQHKKRKAILPIKSIDMNKKQRDYVLKELSRVTKMSMFYKVNFMLMNSMALDYKNKIMQKQLKNEDIEGLNRCVRGIGFYICGFKLY